MQKISLIISVFLFTIGMNSAIYAQCGCMSSISVGMLSPNIGSSSSGTMREGYLLLNLSGNYIIGNKYWSGWDEVPAQTVKEFYNYALLLQSSYGLTNRFSLDLDLGYILKNYIDAPPFKYERKGLSNINLLGKYNFYYDPRNDFEITAGIGGKIPLQMVSDTNYKYTQSSQGAFAGIYQIFLHKGFKTSELHLFLINRGEISARNDADYLYGPYFITSLICTKPISDKFLGLIELKNELKLQDKNPDGTNFDSGFSNIIIAPQIIFSFDNFYTGLKFDYPLLRHYNGSQAVKNFSVNLNFGVNTKLF